MLAEQLRTLLAELEGLSKALAHELAPTQEPDVELETLDSLLAQREALLAQLPAFLSLLQTDSALRNRLETLARKDETLLQQAELKRLAIQQELQGLGRNYNAAHSYLEQGNLEETSYYFENQG